MAKKLGIEAKLYHGDAVLTGTLPAGAPSWTELTSVRDVSTSLDAAEVDVSARDGGGWAATRAGLRNGALELEIGGDTDDAGYQAIRDAYLAGTEISLAVMDGDIATTGSEGFAANFNITGFNRNEPLEGAITVSVTAKPSSRSQWYEVPA